MGGRGPTPETCNGLDDNCDGLKDETFPGQGDACDTGLAGVCQTGRKSCSAGVVTCAQRFFPVAESCDGLDNDCDGLVDEDDNGLLLARPCGNACPGRAVQLCLGGRWGACDVTDVEICNGQDTNCDTRVDNMSRCVRACPNGTIASGTQLCTAAGPVCELPEEICGDALDNDCDGQIDESCNTPNDLRNMVFIPGNTFLMGATSSDPYRQSDETPLHLVELAPYYIDRYEVSRAQYQACVQAGACAQLSAQCPSQPLTGADANKPIACIRWRDARDYCIWRGKRLPTEAEWERAARGPFPRTPLWPWGNTEDGQLARMDCQVFALNSCVATVDSFPNSTSYDGLHHMAGNVAEYVADYYDDTFYTSQLAINPLRSGMTAAGHVIRGGSWYQALRFGRTANRAAEMGFDFSRSELGVRCAKDAP
jgi:formylglycine-generating enzyme required for sulfatase activity